MKLFAIAVLILGFSGCSSTPKAEKKSVLNHLNGEHYNLSPDGQMNQIVVPIVEPKAKPTRVSGTVIMREGIVDIPVRNIRLEIRDDDGTQLAAAMTNPYGDFVLTAPLKNGTYELAVASEKYAGEYSITVDSYEIKGLTLEVKRR